jgi:hypothetical protein
MVRHLARIGAVLSILAFATPTEAAFITGSIDFAGNWFPNGPFNADNATGIDFVPGSTTVVATTGTFASVPLGTVASFTDVANFGSFSGLFFSYTVGSDLTSFQVTSLIVDPTIDGLLKFAGSGLLTVPGFDPTLVTFSFVGSKVPNVIERFTFTANVANAVPEPGSMFLLGSGLIGLAAAARRKWARKA